MLIYVIKHEGAEPDEDPEDFGIVIEGVGVLHGLWNTANACALLHLIYCLNCLYPKLAPPFFNVSPQHRYAVLFGSHTNTYTHTNIIADHLNWW